MIDLVTVVWGRDYTRRYIDYCLASHLSPGNIPGIKFPREMRYRIYCPQASHDEITASWPFKRLTKAGCPVTFHLLTGLDIDRYQTITRCHLHAHQQALASGAQVSICSPDTIASRGYLPLLERLARDPCRATFFACLRISLERALPAVGVQLRDGTSTIDASPRDLVNLLLTRTGAPHGRPYLHDFTNRSITCCQDFTAIPAIMIWDCSKPDSPCFMVHSWHLAPLLYLPRPLAKDRKYTSIDDDMIGDIVGEDPVRVVDDSDQAAIWEFTSDRTHFKSTGLPFEPLNAAIFAMHRTNVLHRRLVRQPVFIHSADITEAQKAAWSAKSAKVLRDIDAWIAHMEQMKAEFREHWFSHMQTWMDKLGIEGYIKRANERAKAE
jgi:hypothetical protein